MIVDELKNLKSYVALNPLFQDVVDFLESNNIEAFETGKHEIKGSDLFVNIEQVKGKNLDEAVLEYHRRIVLFLYCPRWSSTWRAILQRLLV